VRLTSLEEANKLKGSATERLETLEESVKSIEEESVSLLQELQKKVQVHFYTAVEYKHFEDDVSKLDPRHTELLFDARPTDRIRAYNQIRFYNLPYGEDLEILQGWIQYEINEAIKFRLGAVTVPFGRYNLIDNADHLQELTTLPAFQRNVIPFPWSNGGAGFVGNFSVDEKLGPMFKDWTVDYQIYAINGLTNDFSDHDGFREANISNDSVDNNNNKPIVGRLGIHPVDGLELGFSGYYGTINKHDHHLIGVDLDGKYTFGPFDLLAEWAVFKNEESPIESGEANMTMGPQRLTGGQVELHYRFWFDWLNNTVLGRKFEDPKFTAAGRFEWARVSDDDDADRDIYNREQHWVFGLNYRPNPAWVLKVEYVLSDGAGERLSSEGANDGWAASVAAAF